MIYWIYTLVVAAKIIVAQKWKNKEPSTLKEWEIKYRPFKDVYARMVPFKEERKNIIL